jgi:hypothetical protein
MLDTGLVNAHTAGDGFPPAGGDGPDGDGDWENGEGGDRFDAGGEDDDDLVLEPDNPLYTRIRAVLEKQLSDQKQRVTEDLREKEEDLKRLKKKKEDVGVELYGVQQQLARMQLMLEKTHDNFNIIQRLRQEAEEDAKGITKEMEKKKQEVTEQQKRMLKFQAELDKLSATLLQVGLLLMIVREFILICMYVSYGRTTLRKKIPHHKQNSMTSKLSCTS